MSVKKIMRLTPRRVAIALLAVPLLAGCGTSSGGAASAASAFFPYIDATLAPGMVASTVAASGVKTVTVGFVDGLNGGCAAGWDGAGTDQQTVAADVHRLGAHTRFAISFGGRSGTDLAVACKGVRALRDQYAAVLSHYGVSTLDFDIEGRALNDHASIVRRWRAVGALGGRGQVSVTLPVEPTGLTPPGLEVLRQAIAAHVPIATINLLTMDFGDANAPHPRGHMYAFIRRAAISTGRQLERLYRHSSKAQLQRMLRLTPMVGINDTTDEVFTLNDARALVAYAGISGIGSLSMWSIGRDRQCPTGTPRVAQATCSGVAQKPFAFAHVLGRYGGP
jgi:hypothetical protein